MNGRLRSTCADDGDVMTTFVTYLRLLIRNGVVCMAILLPGVACASQLEPPLPPTPSPVMRPTATVAPAPSPSPSAAPPLIPDPPTSPPTSPPQPPAPPPTTTLMPASATATPTATLRPTLIPVPTPTPPPPTPRPLLTYGDYLPPAQSPPGGLAPAQVPQFVTFGSDDNWMPEGVNWFVTKLYAGRSNPPGAGNPATYDGRPIHGSFYLIGVHETYGRGLCTALRNAYLQGNEMGNHTYDHIGGLTLNGGLYEISKANDWMIRPANCSARITGLGIRADDIRGFRAPTDAYNDAMYKALKQLGFTYAASTATGWGTPTDGGNASWPGTLDSGFPVAPWVLQTGSQPGFWEVPQNYMRVPPSLQTKLSIGLRVGYCDKDWFQAGIEGPNITTLLNYNLDQHLSGNRAPLSICVHSQEWGTAFWAGTPSAQTLARQQALLDFRDYALSKPAVRVVSHYDVINWMKNPVPLPMGTATPTPAPLLAPTPAPAEPPGA